jgi:hypothetical protein
VNFYHQLERKAEFSRLEREKADASASFNIPDPKKAPQVGKCYSIEFLWSVALHVLAFERTLLLEESQIL